MRRQSWILTDSRCPAGIAALQQGQAPLRTANARLTVAIGGYLTLSGSLGVP
jgi:hypothetical protein